MYNTNDIYQVLVQDLDENVDENLAAWLTQITENLKM